jgi:hypothetical protein
MGQRNLLSHPALTVPSAELAFRVLKACRFDLTIRTLIVATNLLPLAAVADDIKLVGPISSSVAREQYWTPHKCKHMPISKDLLHTEMTAGCWHFSLEATDRNLKALKK